MRYIEVVDSLWRNTRGLKVLNVFANTVAMVLIFTLTAAIITPKLQGDTDSAPGVLFICMVCAICVSKVVADHTFTAQWGQLMRLRIVGGSPTKLVISILVVQSRMSFISGIFGSLLGVVFAQPLNLLYHNLDIKIPALSYYVLFVSLCITIAVSLIAGSIGAGISAIRIISFPPDISTGIRSGHKKKNQLISLLLLISIVVLLVFLIKRPFDSTNPLIGVLDCLLATWFLTRESGPLLYSTSRLLAERSANNATLLLAYRDKQEAISTSLFTLITIATMLTGMVYSLYGFTDADARASISYAIPEGSRVIRSSTMQKDNFVQLVRKTDSQALSLNATTVFPKERHTTCAFQKRTATTYINSENAYSVTNGSTDSILPQSYVKQGNMKMNRGVIAIATALNSEGKHVQIGDTVCVVSNNTVQSLPIKAIVKFPGTLGDYFIIGQPSNSMNNIAFISGRHKLDDMIKGYTETDATNWINHIPSGKVASKTGGNGIKEAATIVYPVLFICLIGSISIIFNLWIEKKRESKSARLIDFGANRFASALTIEVFMELILSFSLSMVSSVGLINISLSGESQVIAHGITHFFPIPQIIFLFVIILVLAVVAYVVSRFLYIDN